MLEGLGISNMFIASAIVGLILVLTLRMGFSQLSTRKQLAIVGIAIVVVVVSFPALLDNPIGEAVALVSAGRTYASEMGFSFIGFLIGASAGIAIPVIKKKVKPV